MAAIDNTPKGQLVAAKLSEAAYVPVDNYRKGDIPPLPEGWRADTDKSYDSESNQVITFVNDNTRQISITFKGTDTFSQAKSDILNNGAEAYREIKPWAELGVNDGFSSGNWSGSNSVFNDNIFSSGGNNYTLFDKSSSVKLSSHDGNTYPPGWMVMNQNPSTPDFSKYLSSSLKYVGSALKRNSPLAIGLYQFPLLNDTNVFYETRLCAPIYIGLRSLALKYIGLL